MTYQQTLDYLNARLPMYHRVGAQAYKADLGNTIALCRMLGDPQHAFRSVHVTGTNGKGSVSHMLASILQTAGIRTGLYTSPHLKDFRERIRVNGRMIGKGQVTDFIRKYRKRFEPVEPSFFELTVAMAFDHFRKEGVEIAVVEVGLGGRLDSTNIITPLVSVITNVSFDHMQFLGDTLEKIAAEKAGIIKPGVPVVVGETQPETETLFREKAEEKGCRILFADQLLNAYPARPEIADTGWRMPERSGDPAVAGPDTGSPLPSKGEAGCRVLDVYRDGVLYLGGLKSALTGFYQLKNIPTVLAVCEALGNRGIKLHESMIRNGIEKVIENTGLYGRWQVLSRKPLTICDTGHNEAGLREVLAQIRETPHEKLHFIFGVVNDKKLDHILALLPRDAAYYFCKPDIPRGLEVELLGEAASKEGLTGTCHNSVKEALMAARKAAGVQDLVFVGGSTFVVAEVI